jgi:hypothetical protein
MILEILIKANAGRSEPTRKERQAQIAIFLEVLYGHVPEKRLNDCYVHLMRTRTSTYPLAPNELCIAWAAIKESEMNQPSSQKQLTHGFCERCNNTDFEIIIQDGYSFSKPCNHERERP